MLDRADVTLCRRLRVGDELGCQEEKGMNEFKPGLTSSSVESYSDGKFPNASGHEFEAPWRAHSTPSADGLTVPWSAVERTGRAGRRSPAVVRGGPRVSSARSWRARVDGPC